MDPTNEKTASSDDLKTARLLRGRYYTEEDEKNSLGDNSHDADAEQPQRIRCLVVGDPLVGKTSLIYAFINDKSIEVDRKHLLLPGTLETSEKRVEVEKKPYILVLHDTDYKKENRISSYNNADLIILCYSIMDPNSLENIDRKWAPELKQFAPGKPFVIAATKSDLRLIAHYRPGMTVTDYYAGAEMTVKVDAKAFFETSAKSLANVQKLFEELPVVIERERSRDAKMQLAVVTTTTSTATVLQSVHTSTTRFLPFFRQTFHNVWAVAQNPKAFAETKKSIVGYIPFIRTYIPFDDLDTASEPAPTPDEPPKDPVQQRKRPAHEEAKDEDNKRAKKDEPTGDNPTN